jgi:spore germination protein YaaH
MSPNCNRFYLVRAGDGCWALAAAAGTPLDTFYALNPSVGTDCSHLLSGYYVRLGLVGDGAAATTIVTGAPVPAATTSAVVSSSSASSSAAAAATPSPVQTGMAAGCTRFYFVQKGDSCAGIASAAGITTASLAALNPAVGSSCFGLLAGYYICLGTGSVGATIIVSGPPVPVKT